MLELVFGKTFDLRTHREKIKVDVGANTVFNTQGTAKEPVGGPVSCGKQSFIVFHSPVFWVPHTEGRYIADNRMQTNK